MQPETSVFLSTARFALVQADCKGTYKAAHCTAHQDELCRSIKRIIQTQLKWKIQTLKPLCHPPPPPHHHHHQQQEQHGIARLRPHPAFRGLDHDGKPDLLRSRAGVFRTCDHGLVEDVLGDGALLASAESLAMGNPGFEME